MLKHKEDVVDLINAKIGKIVAEAEMYGLHDGHLECLEDCYEILESLASIKKDLAKVEHMSHNPTGGMANPAAGMRPVMTGPNPTHPN